MFKRAQPKWNWRDYLTDEEERRVKEIAAVQARTVAMKHDLATIRNRAVQRAARADARAKLEAKRRK